MLPKNLQEKWNQAEKSSVPVSIGNIVVCDICNNDYTDSPESGGFIFGSSAYCPTCAKERITNIKIYNEEKFIKATCKIGQSFADFVREYRGANNFIQIHSF